LLRIEQAITDTDAKVKGPRRLNTTFLPAFEIVPLRAGQSNHPRPRI